MIKYSLKRLARSMLTIVIILTVLFAMLQVMPIEGYFNNFDKLSQQQIDQGLRELGLKDPLYVQVGRFLLNLFKGDLGVSHRYRENVPITTILADKIPVSFRFGLISMAVSLPLGMILGVLMALNKGGPLDKIGNAYIVVIQAVPNAIYFLLIQVYGSELLNCSMLYREGKPITMVLPILTLAMPSIASYGMWLRRYMVDETNKDYIKLARAKGVPTTTIWFKHVFRNSFVPMIQTIPGSLLMTISGSIYTESLYSIPGMGGLLVDVIKRQDNNMVQVLVLLFAVMGIVGLLLGDIAMTLVDPRISFTKKGGAR